VVVTRLARVVVAREVLAGRAGAAAVRRVDGRTTSLASPRAETARRAEAVWLLLRAVAVEALVQMDETDKSSDTSPSATDASDCIESLHLDETCDANELLGFLSAPELPMCLVALPSSQLETMDAKRRVQSVSCDDDSIGEQLAIMSALPSPERHGCNKKVSFELR